MTYNFYVNVLYLFESAPVIDYYTFLGNWISATKLSLTELIEHKGHIKSILISFLLILFDDSSLQRNDK